MIDDTIYQYRTQVTGLWSPWHDIDQWGYKRLQGEDHPIPVELRALQQGTPQGVPALDANVEAVREAFKQRAHHGFEKYGVTTERTDLSLRDWLQHALEEAMDFCVYLQAAKKRLDALEPPRDREKDRYHFPDKDFNEWLDGGISDAGHTVWDTVSNISAAWAGFEGRRLQEFSTGCYSTRTATREYVRHQFVGEEPTIEGMPRLVLPGTFWEDDMGFVFALTAVEEMPDGSAVVHLTPTVEISGSPFETTRDHLLTHYTFVPRPASMFALEISPTQVLPGVGSRWISNEDDDEYVWEVYAVEERRDTTGWCVGIQSHGTSRALPAAQFYAEYRPEPAAKKNLLHNPPRPPGHHPRG